MLGASRASLTELRASLAERAGVAAMAQDLLAVSALLGSESALRESLADPGVDAAARAGIVESVLSGRVSTDAVSVVADAVALRWSSARDLVDALATLGADAALIGAEQAGRIDQVQDELFRFERTVAESGPLQLALGSAGRPAEERVQIVRDLLEGKVAPETLLLVTDAVANLRGRRIEAALDELVEQAAVRRNELVATVRAAIAPTPEQHQRLAAALTRIYGQPVRLQLIIDRDVMGGIAVTIDDEVIDGTIAHRLQQAERQLLNGLG
jgi:F-type H+-transporting ATPase subunit delta